jgi:CRISP-associated protein Cas1
MKQLTNLKAILHSKRANIYYLEKCRVMQKDGRVLYLNEINGENYYWNIPIANTTVILLGIGTSLTQAAMRMLASAGVLVGFCGGGGTPLFAGNEIEWLSPQNEYRPTEYVQGWLKFWFDEHSRLTVAKHFQRKRIEFLKKVWKHDQNLASEGFNCDDVTVQTAFSKYDKHITKSEKVGDLLSGEALVARQLYKYSAKCTKLDGFRRQHDSSDLANGFLNHGNYLAYGLAACTLWVLGIPHSFAVMHGKTRRGALVFDVADLIKDAIVLPWAFICAKEKIEEQEFRQLIIQKFTDYHALDFMFDQVKEQALNSFFKVEQQL